MLNDRLKYGVAAVFVILGFVLFYVLAAGQVLVVRVLALLGSFAAALGLVWGTDVGTQTREFIQESIQEMKRVTWPTRREAMQVTGVVMALVVVVGIFLLLVDMAWLWVVNSLMGRGA